MSLQTAAKNQQIKTGLKILERHLSFVLPAMAWYYAGEIPPGSILPEKDVWSCVYAFLPEVAKAKTYCFSAENPGCSGARSYFGFAPPSPGAPEMLVKKERFKQCMELGRAFYDGITLRAEKSYLALTRAANLGKEESPEVITLWVNPVSLSGLVTLANYDRPTNDNVSIPFASGCQSIFTIPYQEKTAQYPQCVAGSMDPAVRKHLPGEALSFSIPVGRFLEMAANVPGSFLELDTWKEP